MDDYYDNNSFDIDNFNKNFEKNQEQQKIDKIKRETEELLQKEEDDDESVEIHNMRLGEIFVNMKDEIFGLIYEIISFKFSSFSEFINLFLKNNRLFYFGIFLLLCCIILYIFSYIFLMPSTKSRNDLNINFPNDYSLKYYPHQEQNSDATKNVIKLGNELKNLKKTLKQQSKQIRLQSKETSRAVAAATTAQTVAAATNATINGNIPPSIEALKKL